MSGKLCFGSEYNNAGAGRISASNAFCEGIRYRANGDGENYPLTDNPHKSGDDRLAWHDGWVIANDSVGSELGVIGCCSYTGLIAGTNPILNALDFSIIENSQYIGLF